MRGRLAFLTLLAPAALACGCASTSELITARSQSPAASCCVDEPKIDQQKPGTKRNDGREPNKGTEARDTKENGEKAGEKEKQDKNESGPPKTLLEWAVGPPAEEKPEAEDHIVTDRPDFTEASVTVGLGRVQLEAGYTCVRDHAAGAVRVAQTYPEALLRIGLFADWFELRLGNTYVHSRTTAFGQTTEHRSGMDDLYLGAKLALTEQKGYWPETATILQATVPTGANSLTAGKILPGVSFLYGWDVIPDFLSAGGSFIANRAVDDVGHGYVELAQSFTIGYQLTSQVGAYTEWFALYPTSAIAPDVTAQHYFNGGLTYLVTPDFQLDVRAGWGLNRHAEDFFAGAGFAVRY